MKYSHSACPTNPSVAVDWNSSDKNALEDAQKATTGVLQSCSLLALPEATTKGKGNGKGKHNTNTSGDGGRKWESIMRHAYDNVKFGVGGDGIRGNTTNK